MNNQKIFFATSDNQKIKLEFVEADGKLNRLNIFIDQNVFFIPLQLAHCKGLKTAWVCRRALGITPLSDFEFQAIMAAINEIVAQNHLLEHQTKVLTAVEPLCKTAKSLCQKGLTKKEKACLLKTLKKGNDILLFYANYKKKKFVDLERLQ